MVSKDNDDKIIGLLSVVFLLIRCTNNHSNEGIIVIHAAFKSDPLCEKLRKTHQEFYNGARNVKHVLFSSEVTDSSP